MNIFTDRKLAIILLSAGLLVLIVLILFPNIFGGKKVSNKYENPEITEIKTQSSDTSLDSIKKDLDATDVENLDRELESIEKELNATI